ncbi:MAG: hypothetical protein Ct9H300mP15_09230 [Gemmatimonadota bacterium]|nr:MAG: hypothetical protein Ct9H300mP15_09230 [Gemmatimonadota bacterium]
MQRMRSRFRPFSKYHPLPEMADLVSETIDRIGNSAVTGVEDVLEIDRSARSVATEVAHSLSKTRVGVSR